MNIWFAPVKEDSMSGFVEWCWNKIKTLQNEARPLKAGFFFEFFDILEKNDLVAQLARAPHF